MTSFEPEDFAESVRAMRRPRTAYIVSRASAFIAA